MPAVRPGGRTLLDLPDRLVEPLERNALAVDLSGSLADDMATVRELVEEIRRWNGPETPMLDRCSWEPDKVLLEWGLRNRRRPHQTAVPIDRWPERKELENPLDERFRALYRPGDPDQLARLVADIHRLRTGWDDLREAVADYLERTEKITGFVDEADLRAFADAPDDARRARLLHGPGGAGLLLAWAHLGIRDGTLTRPDAGDARIRVDLGRDVRLHDMPVGRRQLERLLRWLPGQEGNVRRMVASDWQLQHVTARYGGDEITIEVEIARRGEPP